MLSERLGHIFSAVQLLPFISPFLIDPQMDQRLVFYHLFLPDTRSFHMFCLRSRKFFTESKSKDIKSWELIISQAGLEALQRASLDQTLRGLRFSIRVSYSIVPRKIHPTHTREAHRKPPLQTRAMKSM